MTSLTNNDLLSKIAKAIAGDNAVQLVATLQEIGEATDDQLMTKTGMGLNDVRRILFKLYDHSIVQCTRERDKDTGWFIFRWRLQLDQVEGFINDQKRRILKILKTRLEYEEKTDFYYCCTPKCNRVTFDDAVELIFRCPTCGKALQYYDNSTMVKALTDKIEQLEGGKS